MPTKFKAYRDESRLNYGEHLEESTGLCVEQISLGCQLRIADAVEKMASSYDALRDERDKYKRWYEERRSMVNHLRNRIAGLQRAIKRMKKEAKG